MLLIYKSGAESKYFTAIVAFHIHQLNLKKLLTISFAIAANDLSNFPQALWNVVQSSTENLTPRGLSNTFASNIDDLDKSSADNFIQTTRRRKDGEDSARNGE